MNRYCIQCGSELIPMQEDGFPRRVCGACHWVDYMNPRPCVTAVIVNRNSQVLFIRRTQEPGKGLWDFPGGFLEAGEHPEQALVREINEELAAPLTEFQLLGFYPDVYQSIETLSILNIAYLCQIPDQDIQNSDEFDQISWLAADQTELPYAFQAMPCMLKDAQSVIRTLK